MSETTQQLLFYLIILSIGCIHYGGREKIIYQTLRERTLLLPLDTGRLLLWRLFPAVITMAFFSSFSTALFILVTGRYLTIAGYTLVPVCAFLFLQTILLYSNQLSRGAMFLPIMGYFMVFIGGFWLIERRKLPLCFWTRLTLWQLAIILIVSAACIILSYYQLKRIRSGKPLVSWNMDLSRIIRRGSPVSRPFPGPLSAQFWYEQQEKGFLVRYLTVGAIPVFLAIAVTGLAGEFKIWSAIIFLVIVFFGLGPFLISVDKQHIYYGTSSLELGSFRSTRPVDSRDLAFTILKVWERESVFLYLFFWGMIILGGGTIYLFGGGDLLSDIGGDILSFRLPILGLSGIRLLLFIVFASFLWLWIFAGLLLSVTFTGSRFLFTSFVFGIIISGLALFLIPEFWNGPYRSFVKELLPPFLGALLFLGTFLAYDCALRQGHLGWRDLRLSLAGWILLCLTVLFLWRSGPETPPGILFLAAGVLSLVFFPFAAAPLAVHINRHR